MIKKIFNIIALSFYSKQLYYNIAHSWKNWGLAFLLRFSAILSLIFILFMVIILNKVDLSNNFYQGIIKEIPKFEIDYGIAKLQDNNLKLPINIKDIIKLDFTVSEISSPDTFLIYLLKDKIQFNLKANLSFELSYKQIFSQDIIEITPEFIINFVTILLNKLLWSIVILGLPLLTITQFVIIASKSYIYGLLMSFMLKFSAINLDVKQLTRLAIIANVPYTILSAFITFLLINVNLIGQIDNFNNFLFLGYFIFAIMSAKKISSSFK